VYHQPGGPDGFLDASKAVGVYHCAAIVNSDRPSRPAAVRPAISPWRLGGLSPLELGRRVYGQLWKDEVFDRAAGLSYYFLFALFPTLLFFTALLGLLRFPRLMDQLMNYASRVLPGDAASLVTRTLGEIVRGASGELLSIGVVAALWAASTGMLSIMKALNVVFHTVDPRRLWRRRLAALGLTVGLSLFTLIALVLLVFGARIGEAVAQWIGMGAVFTAIWKIAQWPVLIASVFTGITLVYQLAPWVEHRRSWVSPGSVFAVVGWLVVSLGLREWVGVFGGYNATYGSIGGVILLMLWLYLSGLVLLVGAEIDSEIHRAATTPPRE
jgi:membrane protein